MIPIGPSRARRSGYLILKSTILLLVVAIPLSGFGQSATSGGSTLVEYMQRVVEYNEAVQARVLGFHAARSQQRAEGGPFEPAWVTTGEYVDRNQPNTVQQERNLRTGGVFKERNQNYSSAIELQTPLGTRLRLGGTAGQLINNIQRTVFLDLDAEYQTSVGLTVEQPLLKGAGTGAMLASLRLAARSSEVAFQEYRRELMEVIAGAELTYWQLYFAQQEVRLAAESVALAETLVRDSRASLEAGRGSRLDVLEAEAGRALRQSRQTLSRQRLVEAVNRMQAFVGGAAGGAGAGWVAAQAPGLPPVAVAAEPGRRAMDAMSPELLRARAQVGQERVRLGYARVQRRPQLDLKASVGASGLGVDWDTAWKDVEKQEFPSWTVGLELNLPLFGGVRGRNEYTAARLRLLQAQRMEREVATQLRTGLDSALQRVDATYRAAQSYEAIVDFRASLLQTRLQGREVGRLDSRSVLEAEQELFAARLEQLQSAIEYQRALLQLQVTSGTLLQPRGLETGFKEFEQKTARWLADAEARLPELPYRAPAFTTWPTAEPLVFEGDPDPSYPLRLRFIDRLKQN